MGGLAAAHRAVFTLVNNSILAYNGLNSTSIKVSVGNRIQGNTEDEVIINQSTFDVTNLSTADYNVFEFNVLCFSKSYVRAAELADTIYDNCPNDTEIVVLGGANWYVVPLDLFMEYSDRDDYQASVLIRFRDPGE
jgi:hypothetical protein